MDLTITKNKIIIDDFVVDIPCPYELFDGTYEPSNSDIASSRKLHATRALIMQTKYVSPFPEVEGDEVVFFDKLNYIMQEVGRLKLEETPFLGKYVGLIMNPVEGTRAPFRNIEDIRDLVNHNLNSKHVIAHADYLYNSGGNFTGKAFVQINCSDEVRFLRN
tara:strand:+ start:843 stop:1328 length:486 start_codon:yes stop_codon:yes gene_type:complete